MLQGGFYGALSSFVKGWNVTGGLLDGTAKSEHSRTLRPWLEEADRVETSIRPYCAVGCAPRGLLPSAGCTALTD